MVFIMCDAKLWVFGTCESFQYIDAHKLTQEWKEEEKKRKNKTTSSKTPILLENTSKLEIMNDC